MIVEYRAEQATRYILRAALGLMEAVLAGEDYPVAHAVAEAQRIAAETELGPSTRALVEAAEARNIPWRRLNEGSLIQLGYGSHRVHVQSAIRHCRAPTRERQLEHRRYRA